MVAIAHPLPRTTTRPAHRSAAPGAGRPVVPTPRLEVVAGDRWGDDPAAAERRERSLYRWRRAAAAAVLAATVSAVWGLAAAVASTSAGPPPAVAPAVEVAELHVVHPGDTLWTIARRIQPEGDIRPLVDRLAAANGGAELQVGQRVRLQ